MKAFYVRTRIFIPSGEVLCFLSTQQTAPCAVKYLIQEHLQLFRHGSENSESDHESQNITFVKFVILDFFRSGIQIKKCLKFIETIEEVITLN